MAHASSRLSTSATSDSPLACLLQRQADRLTLLAVTLWVGALWSVGFIAVPTLFNLIADRTLAGEVAGRLFELVARLGLVCGFLLLIQAVGVHGRAAWRMHAVWVIVAMLLCAMLIQFGIQPGMAQLKAAAAPLAVMESDFADAFALRHRISTSIYVLQSVLGVVLVVNLRRLLRSNAS